MHNTIDKDMVQMLHIWKFKREKFFCFTVGLNYNIFNIFLEKVILCNIVINRYHCHTIKWKQGRKLKWEKIELGQMEIGEMERGEMEMWDNGNGGKWEWRKMETG